MTIPAEHTEQAEHDDALRGGGTGILRGLAVATVLTMVLLVGIGVLFWMHRLDELQRSDRIVEVVRAREALDACWYDASTQYFLALNSRAPFDRTLYETKYAACTALLEDVEASAGARESRYGLALMRDALEEQHPYERLALDAAFAGRRDRADSILASPRYMTNQARYVHGKMQMSEALPLEARLIELELEITRAPARLASRIDLMVRDSSALMQAAYHGAYRRTERSLEVAVADLARQAPALALLPELKEIERVRATVAALDTEILALSRQGKRTEARHAYEKPAFREARQAEQDAVRAFSKSFEAALAARTRSHERPLLVLGLLLGAMIVLLSIFWLLAWRFAREQLRERRRYEQGLIDAKLKAEQLARLKSTLLANMSHEIRTPLTGILGFSALLEEEVADEQREFAQMIRRSGERLLGTLDAVLNLARLDAGAVEFQPREFDLVEEVEGIVQLCSPRAMEKQVALELEAPTDGLWVRHDPGSIAMIVTNLVSNAVKFTSDGAVHVSLGGDADAIRLTVQDSGVGIEASFLPHLFDEFRQESNGMARLHEGAGLGLAITRRVVDMLGGTIAVESKVGEGATFVVDLPRYAEGHEAYTPEDAVAAG